jgi:hypothetical protein
MLTAEDRPALAELAPVLRRAVALDPRSLARLRLAGDTATVLVRLPFGVLVSRTVHVPARPRPLDRTVRAAEAIDWLDADADADADAGPDADADAGPEARDSEWRSGLPPTSGWHRIEGVPDHVIRDLVRRGALALQDAAAREGVPGAQPRAEVADALLDSAVLTVDDDAGTSAQVTLRALSALTRMGFLPRAGQAYVDTAGRFIRVVAEYGTVYLERPGLGLLQR